MQGRAGIKNAVVDNYLDNGGSSGHGASSILSNYVDNRPAQAVDILIVSASVTTIMHLMQCNAMQYDTYLHTKHFPQTEQFYNFLDT